MNKNVILEEDNKICREWMVDRLMKDGCPREEAEKYVFDQFVRDFYDGDWELFVSDARVSAEYQKL